MDTGLIIFLAIFFAVVIGVLSFARDKNGKKIEIFKILTYGAIYIGAIFACFTIPTLLVIYWKEESQLVVFLIYGIGGVAYFFVTQALLNWINQKAEKSSASRSTEIRERS